MACRQTGFALLASGSVQEAHDIAPHRPGGHAAQSRVPFLHFFDGFRTSHEVAQDRGAHRRRPALHDADDELVRAHRERALTPDRPVLRGTAQNPDVFFQAREACNALLRRLPRASSQEAMDRFAERTGRAYKLFDYVGHPEAERVIVLMGSGAEAAHETVEHLVAQGEKVGHRQGPPLPAVLGQALRRRRCPRPSAPSPSSTAPRSRAPSASRSTSTWSPRCARPARPASATFAVDPKVVGGRYGLCSKEFTPAHGEGGLRRARPPRGPAEPLHGGDRRRRHPHLPRRGRRTSTSSPTTSSAPSSSASAPTGRWAPTRTPSRSSARRPTTDAQGYFVYDSKKSGAITISHLRFGPGPDPVDLPDQEGQLRGLPPVRTSSDRYDVLDYCRRRRRPSC